MDAGRALDELTRLSAEIESAVVVDSSGVVTSTAAAGADRLARAGAELLDIAALVDLERTVDRVVVQQAAGAVFAVRAGEHIAVATTGPEPTVALVVHDLQACLAGLGVPRAPKGGSGRKKDGSGQKARPEPDPVDA